MTKSATIDGNSFSNLDGFYVEVERKLTRGLDWSIGRNLDAFNDVLRGGFGLHEYGEPLELIWQSSSKSEKDLGYAETLKYVEAKLLSCHPANVPYVQQDLEDLKAGKGQMLFDIILGIIRSPEHDHITFTLL